MLPDLERAVRIGEFWSYPQSRTFAELLIDCEEDRRLRGVLVGMLAGGRPLTLNIEGQSSVCSVSSGVQVEVTSSEVTNFFVLNLVVSTRAICHSGDRTDAGDQDRGIQLVRREEPAALGAEAEGAFDVPNLLDGLPFRSTEDAADQRFSWWALEDSNLRPLACKASALPLS